MNKNELVPVRILALDGDLYDIGYMSRGHHSEEAMRAAVAQAYPEGERHPCSADPGRCVYVQAWWRVVPRFGGGQYVRAMTGARGAFPVTALLVPGADI